MRLLLDRETCFCGELVADLPLAQATVSQHLKVLRDAGLIRGEIDGPRVCYCASRATLERAHSLVGALVQVPAAAYDRPGRERLHDGAET